MAKYLVTGVAGFIASKVTEFLLADGHTVIGVDNLNDAYDIRLKHWRLEQITKHPNLVFHRVDICDRKSICELFRLQSDSSNGQFDAVINLAARAGVRQSVKDPWVYVDTNVTGTLNLLDMCRQFGVPKFVLASSSSLYGKDNPMPYKECATTDHPLSPYAASKKAAEALCYSYHHLHHLDITVFRYFTVYGPAGRPDMSPLRFVQWISEGKPLTIYGDGRQSRDFTYVDDIARGTIAGLRPVGYETINLGSDKPVILIDVISMMEKLIGAKANLHYEPPNASDVSATWADISKANTLLKWQPKYSLYEGLTNLVSWYSLNIEWTKELRM